ncbi:hypothetical protein FE257_006287 [Aspergillus nanangensis]|uniref:Cytochrome P450 n=1 Tax=Aspergillus nanangensis TaxID=2582783 RepID=A0AAD4GUV8_ASPNN|nr:hypothetical protein FE257_006287 [Aspergillus nanangensis]
MVGYAIVLVSVFLVTVRLLCNYTRLNSIPGPKLAGFSDLWRVYARKSPHFTPDLVRLHEEHGTVVRVGPNSLSVSNPAAIRPVRRRRPRNTSTLEDHDIGRLRHFEISRYEGVIDHAVRSLANTFRRHQIVDLALFLQFFSADFFDSLRGDERTEESNDNARASGCELMWMDCIFNRPTYRLKRARGVPSLYRGPHSPMNRHVRESARLLQLAQRNIRVGDRLEDCPVEQNLICLGESLTLTFALLLRHPGAMANLRSEITAAYNTGFLSNLPRWAELNRLAYLDAVMKESLRLLPNATCDHDIVTSPDGAIIDGHYIPQGTGIGCYSEALHHNAEIYGEYTHMFRPERWQVASPQHHKCMTQYLLPSKLEAFDHPRIRTVWLELKKVVVLILMEFEMQLLHTTHDAINDKTIAPVLSSMMVQFVPKVD